MKTYYKFLLAFIFLSFAFSSNAQWYKLQAYKDPFAGNTSIQPNSSRYPALPLVMGNGAIAYFGTAYVLNFQSSILEESTDDLNTGHNAYPAEETYLLESLTSKNDSTYSLIASNYYNTPTVYYTTDNFSTEQSSQLNISNFPGILVTACFSTNYIYTAAIDPQNAKDSLKTFRTNIQSNNTTQYLNFKYTSPTKIKFTSDSVGYMLCIYQDDSAKSTLARTADSGKTWGDSFSDSLNRITDFCFPTANIGYLTESNGSTYQTINAGASWNKITGPAINNLNCISFSNSTSGYVAGNNGKLYETINSGASWSSITSGTNNNIVALYTFGSVAYFKDDTNGLYKNQSPIGIETLNSGNSSITVYPNPSNGKFNFAINNGQLTMDNKQMLINIYNMLGQVVQVFSFSNVNSTLSIDLSNQPSGIYFYRISSGTGSPTLNGKLMLAK